VRSSHQRDVDFSGLALIAIDLPDTETALEIGKKIAEKTGRIVTVRAQDGTCLATFRPTKH